MFHSATSPRLQTEHFFCLARASDWFFTLSEVGFLVIRSAKAARSPSESRQLLGPHQFDGRSARYSCYRPTETLSTTRRRKFGRFNNRLPNPLASPFDLWLSQYSDRDLRAWALELGF